MKPPLVVCLSLLLACGCAQAATVTVGPWTPLFKGVELASGWQQAQLPGEIEQRALCLRVDLMDPDIELFTTPKCTNCGSYETLAENTSHFLEQYGLQVAINGAFYASSSGPGDVPLGTPEDVYGLAISRGVMVSPNQTTPANPQGYILAVLMFTTNNQAIFVPTNNPPASIQGIYTAIAGNKALLINGTNQMVPTPNDLDPRTALGVSADRRYLYLLTIDGRQPGWSSGADYYDTGEWLKRFGASDGINVDGGGSTTMVMADCLGKSIRLNRSSFVAAYGRERIVGHNFGVYAKPLPGPIKHLTVVPGRTTALITWLTDVPATGQVEYGLTTNYGSITPLDSRLLRRHVASLSGLSRGSNYYFRVRSTAAGQEWTAACQFTTLSGLVATELFGLTKSWRYTTNNLDGVNWKAPGYDDAGWLGEGPGLLCVENSASVRPKNTALPPPYGQTISRTYYFRTHFTVTGTVAGASLTFSNYIDDGAVFYLNGVEVYRVRMPAAPNPITYSTAATGVPCAGTAQAGDALPTCPDVFTLSGSVLTNLVQGDNLLAVEVHNYGTLSSGDIVFGCALLLHRPVITAPRLDLWLEDGHGTLFWNEEGFTLQQSPDPAAPDSWSDVPGPVTRSPYTLTNPGTMFYRLRN
jgi:hypothetical protein